MFSRRGPPPSADAPRVDDFERVLAYHRATKHDFNRYATGPDELDWATQPDPFRRYAGAELVALEHPRAGDGPSYADALAGRVDARPLDRRALSQLLYDSLALSAWKRYGESRWSLRVNPSSGNLHPTEGYVVSAAIDGVCEHAFVAHYAPREHALEIRARIPDEVWSELARGLPHGALFVGFTSIHWREAWKYGERAFRYCQHDVGHALGALAVAAAGLGWSTRACDELGSEELGALLGVAMQRGPDAEHVDVLVAVAPRALDVSAAPTGAALAACSSLSFVGFPNELSSSYVEWDAIESAAQATRKSRTSSVDVARVAAAEFDGYGALALREIVRGRRSAVALDSRITMTRDAFLRTLRRTLVGVGGVAHDVLPWEPLVDLVVHVHRVEGVEPGLYVLPRGGRRVEHLRSKLRSDFEWFSAAEVAPGLPLLRLRGGDARSLARSTSCNQDIAADGCFAVAMLAEFAEPLTRDGAWKYRRMFWECGLIGQLLYLEAEACGLRGTGIGCFFDDALHRALGLESAAFQDLYHFTVGRAVDDARITAEPAYQDHGTSAGGAAS